MYTYICSHNVVAMPIKLPVKQTYLTPFLVQIVHKLLLAIFVEELLQIFLGLLCRSSWGAFEQVMGAVFAAGSSNITFPTEIVAPIVAL